MGNETGNRGAGFEKENPRRPYVVWQYTPKSTLVDRGSSRRMNCHAVSNPRISE